MNYDVVKESVICAYKSFKSDNKKFSDSMNNFFYNGKENPSVAKIIMREYFNEGLLSTNKMLSDVAAMPTPTIAEPYVRYANEKIYTLALTTALKSVEADEIYKHTKCCNSDNADLNTNAKKEFLDSWKEKYPRTGKLRDRIIDANRLSMKEIKPKATWFEKINFAKMISEYLKDYPKSFYTRYSLLSEGQINETKVTPRVEGWFKRFSYKMLMKGKLRFKK